MGSSWIELFYHDSLCFFIGSHDQTLIPPKCEHEWIASVSLGYQWKRAESNENKHRYVYGVDNVRAESLW